MAGPGDALYDVEPAAFVAARGALVKELKAAGDKAAAAAVAALRRPSPGAWALNQAARTEPALLGAALHAGAALRDATEVEGASADERRAAMAAERAAVHALWEFVAPHLGPKAADARLEVLATVRASAHDPDLTATLAAGTLTELRGSSGFGFGFDAGAAPAPARRSVAPTQPAPVDEDDRAAAAAAREEAARAAAAEQAEREAAERERRRRRAELEDEADRLRRRAARLTDEASAAEAAAREAWKHASEAAEAAAQAEAVIAALDEVGS